MKVLLIIGTVILYIGHASAQIPQDLPHKTDPVDFSEWQNVLLFIGLPLLMILTYILLKRRAGKNKNANKNR